LISMFWGDLQRNKGGQTRRGKPGAQPRSSSSTINQAVPQGVKWRTSRVLKKNPKGTTKKKKQKKRSQAVFKTFFRPEEDNCRAKKTKKKTSAEKRKRYEGEKGKIQSATGGAILFPTSISLELLIMTKTLKNVKKCRRRLEKKNVAKKKNERKKKRERKERF